MANMYPHREDMSDAPYSEKLVFDALSQLDDDFYVFHSVQWIIKKHRQKSIWKENDFLILHKQYGGLVLEVKGGEIEYRAGVFLQTNTETREVSELSPKKKNDPLSQAIDGRCRYNRVLDGMIPHLSDRFPIETAVWFPACNVHSMIDSFPLSYREIDFAVLGNEDFARGKNAIMDIFSGYDNPKKTKVSDEEFRQILDSIASDFNLIAAPAYKKGNLDHAFLKLTNEQTSLLDYISEQNSVTIQGVAGTGKTLIAKEAARRFGMEERKVLFLCFNRLLYLDLKKRYPYENVTYLNIHSLLAQYRPGAEISSDQQRAEVLHMIDWDELGFDDIVIDEAQDFQTQEILYFRNMMEDRNGRFLVFYDRNQLVQKEKIAAWITESECRLVLTKNCRNTREIALTAYNVIDVELNQKILMISGEQTSISFVRGQFEPALSRLIMKLTGSEYEYEPSDIVLVSLSTEEQSVLRNTRTIAGIPVTRDRDKDGIFFTTARKFKGLESRVIIIVDVDTDCFMDAEKKRLFYVACSRATQKLALIVNADDSQIKDMADAINMNARFAPKGRIAMKTQATILDL